MLITAAVGMSLTPSVYWRIDQCILGLLGIALAACSGGICNQIFEQNIDAEMSRTKHRPLVKSQISQSTAYVLSSVFLILSGFILYVHVNPTTYYLTFITMFGYSVIYTKLLKPRTCQNIVIGGLFGAMPPLLGWTALTGTISIHPIILVAIIFTWTPSHFWALALTKVDDYEKTNLPMLPVTHGIACTQVHILAYTVLLIITTQLPTILTLSSYIYSIGVNILNAWLFHSMWRIYQNPSYTHCITAFKNSNIYLLGVFTVTLLDKIIC